jgi:hypothetical protein
MPHHRLLSLARQKIADAATPLEDRRVQGWNRGWLHANYSGMQNMKDGPSNILTSAYRHLDKMSGACVLGITLPSGAQGTYNNKLYSAETHDVPLRLQHSALDKLNVLCPEAGGSENHGVGTCKVISLRMA